MSFLCSSDATTFALGLPGAAKGKRGGGRSSLTGCYVGCYEPRGTPLTETHVFIATPSSCHCWFPGNEPRWYAKLESLRFIDTNGQVLVTSSLAYLDNVSGSAVSLFRIAKGEMAEAVGLESAFDVYSQIAAIEVGAVDPGSSRVSPGFKASIAATDLCKTNKGFVVSLVNRGAQTAGVSNLHRYLLSDGEGPVAVGFLQRLLPLDKSTGVKPNERSILAEEAVFSDGRADRATIFSVSYDGSIGSFESPPQASFSTAGNVALQIRRQAAQDFKREQFKLWAEHLGRTPLHP